MSVAVLPFNAGPDAPPTIARQLSNFAAEIVRQRTGKEIHSVNYLIQVEQEPTPRFANVNPAETLNEPELVQQLFQQAPADIAIDGLLESKDGQFDLTYRVFNRGNDTPASQEKISFSANEIFKPMRAIIEELYKSVDEKADLNKEQNEALFGTDNSLAFYKFIEGYDALQYIEKTQGQVVNEFRPKFAFDALVESMELDSNWEAPEIMLLQLTRACTQLRIGTSDDIIAVLNKMTELRPEDVRPLVVTGELKQAIGDLPGALEVYEKAIPMDSNEPALYTRLGIVQMNMGMPANAEQSFRKALELEGEDKPSTGFLAQVLTNSGRGHEVPPLWKEIVEAHPTNSHAWANYGASVMHTGNTAEALRIFDQGMEKAEDPNIVKRAYAPALTAVQEWDKAMDFYEDCLELAPKDVQLMLEYAQTLQGAGRTFEVPKILRDVLGANPDPNTRAQTLAWLVEIEQPKRVESVVQAEERMKSEDFGGAVKILRPMRNWLADYWKMWALYSSALNHVGEHREAEDAANRLIQLFPGNEIGFVELGNSLMAQEKFEEAYNAMRYGMSTINGSLGIAVQYGLAAKRFGQGEEAKNMAQQIRTALPNNAELEPVLKEMES